MGGVRLEQDEIDGLKRLEGTLARVRSRGVRRLDAEAVRELPELYRLACSLLARLESRGGSPVRLHRLRRLASEAHGVLFRGTSVEPRSALLRFYDLVVHEAPRTIREEWRLFALTFGVFYGLAIAAFVAVTNDLSLAFSLFQADAVANEISQLEATAPGEAFRGNFTFGLGESPQTAGWIMVHNMGIGALFFGAALIPPFFLLLLLTNSLMLGTYTAVAGHWDQAGSISSILWCHGTIELQAIVLAAAAGLVLVRAVAAPGPWSRAVALKLESRRAWALLAPVFPLLFVSGLIEGFVSPHFPLTVRVAVAVVTGLGLVAWVALGGRGDVRRSDVGGSDVRRPASPPATP